MTNTRRHLILIALAGAAAFSGCGRPEHAGLAPDVRRELEGGRAALEDWVDATRRGGEPSDEVVIGLGYVERLRLGLGSPFRLIEATLRDPRLSDPVRRDLAWALLALTLSGDGYQVDALALDRAGSGPALGRQHLDLIESAVVESRDPRAGELAVRLAYRLAAMEGSLPRQAPPYATRVAALIRDRELARADVVRLLRSAELVQGDPLLAISQWRSERWLRVESPALASLPEQSEREALELAPKLAQTLRTLGARQGERAAERDLRGGSPDAAASWLTPTAARRLAQIADSVNMPPQAPIAIAIRMHRQELVAPAGIDAAEIARREALLATTSEESFVARYAQVHRISTYDIGPSLTALWTAVALRPLAQEPIWFPGFGGPTARELEERFGFAAVRFAESLPAEWRPYYRTQLERAVQDMQRVLPALDLGGLSVRFTDVGRTGTLAMHDPKARELLLPPGSSAGTVAHEIAHDLDWQVALRRYRVRGDYASDRAARTGTDRLAARVRDLSQSAALDYGVDDRAGAHARRPAENFARAVDWFVTASLASQGRTNGYLSSVQDNVLTGYGTVRPPDISGRSGDALINILDEVAPLYPETRDWFLRSYGSARAQDAFDLIRGMMEVDLPDGTPAGLLAGAASEDVTRAFDALATARARGLAAIDEWICRVPAGAHNMDLERARRRLVGDAAAARARGVALQHAERLSGEAGARWVAHQLYGGPWPAQDLDEGMVELLAELVAEAKRIERTDARPVGQTFELLKIPAHCTQQF